MAGCVKAASHTAAGAQAALTARGYGGARDIESAAIVSDVFKNWLGPLWQRLCAARVFAKRFCGEFGMADPTAIVGRSGDWADYAGTGVYYGDVYRVYSGRRAGRDRGDGGNFLPAFVFVALTNPFLPRLRQSKWFGGLLDGVNVASAGLMAGVTLQPAAALIDVPTVLIALVGGILLFRLRVNSTWLVLGGAGVGLALGLWHGVPQ